MSITLDIPQELESELAAEAARLGLSLTEYVLHLLSSTRGFRHGPQTGGELVEFWKSEGLIGSRPEISDSQTHARQIREQAERRKLA